MTNQLNTKIEANKKVGLLLSTIIFFSLSIIGIIYKLIKGTDLLIEIYISILTAFILATPVAALGFLLARISGSDMEKSIYKKHFIGLILYGIAFLIIPFVFMLVLAILHKTANLIG